MVRERGMAGSRARDEGLSPCEGEEEEEEGKAGRGRRWWRRGGGGGRMLWWCLRASGAKRETKQEIGVPVPLRSGVSVAELYTVPALAAVWDQHVSRGGLGTCPTCQ